MAPNPLNPLARIAGTIVTKANTVRVLTEAGMIRPTRPDRLARMGLALHRWGATPAAGLTASAARHPDRTAIVDELGEETFADVHRRSNALSQALRERGLRSGDNLAVMCRDHRWFIEATVASSKLGTHSIYMNTGFAGPQLAEVAEREGVQALIYDEEFAGLLADVPDSIDRYVAWADEGQTGEAEAPGERVENLIRGGSEDDLDPPAEPGRTVILTSGTTGTPKGARRSQPGSLDPLAAMLSKIPLHAQETTMIAAPMFHSWGFAHFSISLGLGSTLVLRRRFDPEGTLRATAETGATALVVVPVMLQRIMQLPKETRRRYDLGALRVVAVSGSALPGDLAIEWMNEWGDNVYNLYGSTEVAWATIATPEDLRRAPGTAGLPPRGTRLTLLDEEGGEVAQGEVGRIFVRNEMAFEGYTGGGGKQIVEDLLSTGDVGHLDEEGRLFVDGRDDDMIVSGGENVFPREVEDLIAGFEEVGEVAVIGVPDDEFGQRLKAFVVKADGAEISEEEVKSRVKAGLARYKVPREVEFLDDLPRNPTGKVLKRELK